ncbi:MAG: dynamin family protein [Methylobacter sp.]|nr:dynamin family protein [Candidatus Methylobacter titanis]
MTNQQEIEKFFATVSSFEQIVMSGEIEREKALLNQKNLLSILREKLQKLSSSNEKMNSLSDNINQVSDGIINTIKIIEKSSIEMDQRLQLQREYKERLIILVFGKVNSGKSSFSNYFVSLFPQTLPEEPYFFFEDGKKKYSSEPFKVGCTETTSRIQGVELGKLVLLDTPGLHSVTGINGDLTKQYTDSADLILWLSGSNSPGQTQELEELKNEIEKGKVLFPIITKSDITDEDEEIKNGEPVLIKKLIMKSIGTQELQQEDVYKRAQAKLKEFKVNIDSKKPISLSVQYAKEYSEQENVMMIAGISKLFYGLNAIYDEAIESKKSNVLLQVKNNLRDIHKHLDDNIEKPFNELLITLENQKENVRGQSGYIHDMVLNSVRSQVPGVISKHIQSKNIKAINVAINKVIIDELNAQLDISFNAVFKSLLKAITPPGSLGINLESNFEDETISFDFQRGARKKAVTSGAVSSGGAVAGAALGSFLGPVGAAIGGLLGAALGGLAGSKAGEYFIETETITNIIGIDATKVEAELNSKLQEIIPKLVSDSIGALLIQFKPLEDLIKQSNQEIEQFKRKGDYS